MQKENIKLGMSIEPKPLRKKRLLPKSQNLLPSYFVHKTKKDPD